MADGGSPATERSLADMLRDIEANMPPLNPWCLDELRAYLGDTPLAELQEEERMEAEVMAIRKQAEVEEAPIQRPDSPLAIMDGSI